MNEKNNKMDFNKTVYTIIGILIGIIIIAGIFIAISNNKKSTNEEVVLNEPPSENNVEYHVKNEAEKSEIEEGDLPSDSELSGEGLENVMQTSKLNEQFNLSEYEITDDGIRYNYLANAVTNGERLSITAKAMSEEEYNEMLPKAKAQENTINDISVVYNDRSLYYTTSEDEELPAYIKKADEAGNVVIRYGNSLSELVPMQQLMWYKDGIGYTLESIARNYTYEDMAALAEDFFESAN